MYSKEVQVGVNILFGLSIVFWILWIYFLRKKPKKTVRSTFLEHDSDLLKRNQTHEEDKKLILPPHGQEVKLVGELPGFNSWGDPVYSIPRPPKASFSFGSGSVTSDALFMLSMLCTVGTLALSISKGDEPLKAFDKLSIASTVLGWIFAIGLFYKGENMVAGGLSMIAILNSLQLILAQQDVEQAWINRIAIGIVGTCLIVIVKLSTSVERHYLSTVMTSIILFLNTVHIVIS